MNTTRQRIIEDLQRQPRTSRQLQAASNRALKSILAELEQLEAERIVKPIRADDGSIVWQLTPRYVALLK